MAQNDFGDAKTLHPIQDDGDAVLHLVQLIDDDVAKKLGAAPPGGEVL